MAVYTVKVLGLCDGGNHVHLELYRDAVKVRDLGCDKRDLLEAAIDFEALLYTLLRVAIKNAGATTLAQAKAAVEVAQWVI